jgi:hypothetical protein
VQLRKIDLFNFFVSLFFPKIAHFLQSAWEAARCIMFATAAEDLLVKDLRPWIRAHIFGDDPENVVLEKSFRYD